ncbi:glycosyltransferase family 39 protein [Streptomyces sp. 4F14]|uniref:glycosyltransferase family 39 protein n=1 Tax=Streptomyces sp. 4F14 TaxID=3394380 RepID=UPI003A852081
MTQTSSAAQELRAVPPADATTVEVVIPVYNEERALPGCIRTLHARLRDELPCTWRITVADNASTDATLSVARALAGELPGVGVVHLDRKGRGLALRTVWGASDAEIVVYMDVDLSTGLDGLLPLVAPLLSGHSDLAIGSRLAPGARTVRGPRRELISRCYNALIRLTHGARFTDAQCGFKAARTEAVRPLLAKTHDDAWFFDTELLLLAEHNGLRIHEVPVDWVEDVDTRVDVVSTAADDLKGLWRMARLKASGEADVPVPTRPEPAAEHPDAVLAPGRSELTWQIACFAAIGIASTAGQALLYWTLRTWWSPAAANLASLLVLTLLNTEANRRLTFRRSPAGPGRAHLGAGGLLIVGYLITSAAVLLYRDAVPDASRGEEALVLAVASVLVTGIRFLVLRLAVFRPRPPRPEAAPLPYRAALAAILLTAALLYGWALGSLGWGNSYYSAAVKSMGLDWTNFLFGSFDPAGVVTVDKPPAALWPQVLSSKVFGLHGWALILPQVLEGVAAVFVLHRTVRRWAGEGTALLAALVLTLTPVTVAINRNNNPDTLLVLLLVTAAYALTRALQAEPGRRATGWLCASGFLVGCGFLTKMTAAWMVLPAFAAAWLTGAGGPWLSRLRPLLAAGAVCAVSSLWWVALVARWPGERPAIGGSADGGAWDLVIGHNGLGRLLGGSAGGGGGNNLGGLFGSDPGPLRLFGDQVAGQIGWLLPVSVVALAVAVAGAVLRRRGGGPAGKRLPGSGWVLWGTWLLVCGLVFSTQEGSFHAYYTTQLAPPVAALSAALVTALVRAHRAGARWALPVGTGTVLTTAAWAVAVIRRVPSWHGWLGWVVAALGVTAVALLITAARKPRLSAAALAGSVLALLLAPGAWAVSVPAGPAPVVGAAPPSAGPAPTGKGLRHGLGALGGVGSLPGSSDGSGSGPGGDGTSDNNPGSKGDGGRPGGVDGAGGSGGADSLGAPGGLGGTSLSAGQRRILAYATHHARGARIPLAVDGGAVAVAAYILDTDATVIGLGGFLGTDHAPSPRRLAEWTGAGDLRYVLDSPGGVDALLGDKDGPAAQRAKWFTENCAEVPPKKYGGTGTKGGTTLYDCAPNPRTG